MHALLVNDKPAFCNNEGSEFPRRHRLVRNLGVLGPLFFDTTVTADSYLHLLEHDFLPELVQCHMQQEVCIFQQDGAPAHFPTKVRRWLDANFPNWWMGRGSASMSSPARSPDLTPCDFFVWGYMKSLVYRSGPVPNIQALKKRIQDAFTVINDDMREAVFHAYTDRLQKCVDADGGHFEK